MEKQLSSKKLIDLINKKRDKSITFIFTLKRLDIKFNQKKSVVITNDPNLPQIKMDGESIPIEKETRYLGSQISSEDTNSAHIKTRIKKAKSAAGILRGVGLLTSNLKPKTKAFLFKVFFRPIIQYGVETCCLSQKQLKILRKNETMLFKSVIGINKQVRNTELMLELKVSTTDATIERNQLKFFIRLTENLFISKLMEEIHWLRFNTSFTIILQRELNLRADTPLESLYHFANLRLTQIVAEEIEDRTSCPVVKQIQMLTNLSNHFNFVAAMRKLIGFQTKNQAA